MNIENINRLITALEQSKEVDSKPKIGFNMSYIYDPVDLARGEGEFFDHTGHHCGTVACICGWAVSLKNNFDYKKLLGKVYVDGGQTWEESAADWLGIDAITADRLFYPASDDGIVPCSYANITIDHAIEALRTLRDTGDVSWSNILPKEFFDQ